MSILEREQLAALRASTEWISIRAEWKNGEPIVSEIIGKCRDARDESYAKVVIQLPSGIEYGSSIVRDHETVHAYESVSTPRFHAIWQTILALLRTGDELSLAWSANGHANSITHDAGLCVDSVELEVRRKNRRLRFLIGFHVTLPNTARMFTASKNGTYLPIYGPDPRYLATHGEAA